LSKAALKPDVRPWVLYALGMSQAGLGRQAEALASWERVRQAAPDFEPVYMDLADTYGQLSDLTRALGVLREAEKRWPKSADVQTAIGVIHVHRGALDEGISKLTLATTLAPDDPLVQLNPDGLITCGTFETGGGSRASAVGSFLRQTGRKPPKRFSDALRSAGPTRHRRARR
ncbi:MAG: tetratricopeptide repeat protein, partial [Acidobacteriota bacterium]|nr:tetratricopeptide repeat protein [Acidobacteriota bacterium]